MLDPVHNLPSPASIGAPGFCSSDCSHFSRRKAPRTAMTSYRHRTGSAIFHQTDAAEYFYEVLSGIIFCSVVSVDGRRQIYRFAGQGDIIGLAGEESYGYSAEVARDCTVDRHSNDLIEEAFARDVELKGRLFESMRREVYGLRRHLHLLGLTHSVSKVATLLLEMEQAAMTSCRCLKFPGSRAQMADYLCMSPETLCRKLGDLRLAKLIEMPSAQKVRILHREGLERIAAQT